MSNNNKKTMIVLVSFLFASQILAGQHIFGKIIVIREENIEERLLTCLSEDDGSALVWNNIITEKSKLDKSSMSKY